MWVQLLLLLENLFIVYLVLHPTWMIQGMQLIDIGEDKILWGPLYLIYSSHISLLFLAGFVILFKKWRKAGGLMRQQILYILGGYFLGANLAMTTNLIMPWLGYFELNWLGQFFSTLLAVFTTYAILRYQLLNIKVVTTEGLLIILNLFLFFQFIIADNIRQFLINGTVLIVVLLLSYLLIKSAKKEIQRREEITSLAHSLEKTNLKLKELDKQKTEFLDIASHQLRTPLSALIGLLSMQYDGDFDTLPQAEIKQQ